MAVATAQKIFGAFFTSERVATYLIRWSIKNPEARVLDPSCGDGVFLSLAKERLESLGKTDPKVFGVDLDPRNVEIAKGLSPHFDVTESDFFAIRPQSLGQFDAVVGNPPFIRYQTFSGSARIRALQSAQRAGVLLPQLTSSWAPFLIHASEFVKPGGKLAMVVPAELGHARYSREVLRYLAKSFRRIRICVFKQKLFPTLSEDTYLLLAEGRGDSCSWFSICPFETIDDAFHDRTVERPIDYSSIETGRLRISHYLLSTRALQLYQSLQESNHVLRFGEAADVGIGYVTGANDFFHLSEREITDLRVPKKFLLRAVVSLAAHRGVAVEDRDWLEWKRESKKVYLLRLGPIRESHLLKTLRDYIALGRKSGIANRFKCRVREPWYSVPHIRVADAFLTYMSGGGPRLVYNRGKFVAPNTLHLVRFLEPPKAGQVVSAWYSSLTRLSTEMEGHALGGGMLKLEPSEAENLITPIAPRDRWRKLLGSVDKTLRDGCSEEAREITDALVLRQGIGLSATECVLLAESASQLEKWRMHK